MNRIIVLFEGSNEMRIIDMLLDNQLLKITRDDLVGLVPYHARLLKPNHLKMKIGVIRKYCTKPELEILLIINEKLVVQFHKGKMRAKEFAKRHIIFQKMIYDNSSKFYEKYYGDRIICLVDNLKEYKRIKKQGKDELYLIDLIKEDAI